MALTVETHLDMNEPVLHDNIGASQSITRPWSKVLAGV